ncbi:MAG: VOC family protein, partial [Nitrososphaerales archaeon]
GTTLTVNVATREEVDDAIATALAAGARAVGSPVEREWGGYTGYFSDPEGHRWEIAWAPFFTEFD